MVSCAVKGCKSRSDVHTKIDDISFHRIPLDKALRDKWMEKLDSVINLHKSARICSRHFCASNFKSNGKTKTLFKNALPDQNLPDLKALEDTPTSSSDAIQQDHDSNHNNLMETDIQIGSPQIMEQETHILLSDNIISDNILGPKCDEQEYIQLISQETDDPEAFKNGAFSTVTLLTTDENLYEGLFTAKIDNIYTEVPPQPGEIIVTNEVKNTEYITKLENISGIKTSTPLEFSLKHQLEVSRIICKRKDEKIKCLQMQKKRLQKKIRLLEQQLETTLTYPVEQEYVILDGQFATFS